LAVIPRNVSLNQDIFFDSSIKALAL